MLGVGGEEEEDVGEGVGGGVDGGEGEDLLQIGDVVVLVVVPAAVAVPVLLRLVDDSLQQVLWAIVVAKSPLAPLPDDGPEVRREPRLQPAHAPDLGEEGGAQGSQPGAHGLDGVDGVHAHRGVGHGHVDVGVVPVHLGADEEATRDDGDDAQEERVGDEGGPFRPLF